MRVTRIIATFAMLVCIAPRASAQMFVATGHDTLRGLPGVEVVVESVEPELERDGVTRAAIQSEVEQRLKARGIPVYPSQNANPSPAKAYLYVHLTPLKLAPQNLYAIGVQVHVRQTLHSLVTASNIVDAMTWDANDLIAVPIDKVTSVHRTIQESVDRFIQDWLAVH